MDPFQHIIAVMTRRHTPTCAYCMSGPLLRLCLEGASVMTVCHTMTLNIRSIRGPWYIEACSTYHGIHDRTPHCYMPVIVCKSPWVGFLLRLQWRLPLQCNHFEYQVGSRALIHHVMDACSTDHGVHDMMPYSYMPVILCEGPCLGFALRMQW